MDDADDADGTKAAVIALIVQAERGVQAAQLRAELEGMKLSALKKRAKRPASTRRSWRKRMTRRM